MSAIRGGTYSVSIGSKTYEVTVYQRSKSVWIATGDFMGETLKVKDRSQTTALSAWREAARYRRERN
jgi:hypothetical protein